MIGILRIALVACCFFGLLIESAGQTFKDVSYTSDDSNFANPERGFYKHTESTSTSYSALSETTLRNFRQSGHTLIIRVLYLEKFVDEVLSPAYLENVNQDFITARKAGVKIILRFAYTKSSTAPYKDATPARVLQHIRQLGPLLREHSDVIAVMQAGFVGAWGEWYYTDHFSQLLGSPNEADWVNRRAVVDAMLAELPADRVVQVRTPQIKRKLVQSTTAINSGEAFGTTSRARVGHHNDCFLASPDDYGTYINQNDEKPYLEAETQYLPMGGETCGPYVPLSECPNAIEQMKRFHWSYLNRDYHTGVLSSWNTGQCLDDVERNLGYRFALNTSSFQEQSKPGGEVKFTIALTNEGWAAPYNKRLVELVLRNKTTLKEHKLQLNEDPRNWLPGQHSLVISAGLPASIEAGDYDLFLNLPAPELSLRKNADYSVRLANAGVWEATTGYNKLNHTLTVATNAVVPAYTGSDFFLSTENVPETLPVPTALIASSFGNSALLFWGLGNTDLYRVIQRAENAGTYATIATLPGTVFTYTDKSLAVNSTYSYRSYLSSGNAISPTSPSTQIQTTAVIPPYYVHRSDGDLKDWVSVKPIRTLQSGNETYAFRLFADKDSLYFHAMGNHEHYRLYIDHNNTPAVGINEQWTSAGFDYQLKDDSLFRANGAAWTFVVKTKSKKVGNNREGSVPLSRLEGLGTNVMMHVAMQVDNLSLPAAGGNPVDYIRSLAPSSLLNFNVEVQSPTILNISWQACASCIGVLLERSTFPDKDFVVLTELLRVKFIFYDESVETGKTYYYRAAAYNETGVSNYTAVLSGKAEVITGVEDEESSAVYPNPVTNRLMVRASSASKITMTDALGRVVNPTLVNQTTTEQTYDVSRFASGIYIVRVEDGGKTISVRIRK